MAARDASPIDDYLRTVPEDRRPVLQDLRAKIRAVVPDAEECISYGMPAFRLPGGVVAGFQATKAGGSYYPFSGTTLATVAAFIRSRGQTKSALHFSADAPLSLALVRRLIRARLAELDAAPKAKAPRAAAPKAPKEPPTKKTPPPAKRRAPKAPAEPPPSPDDAAAFAPGSLVTQDDDYSLVYAEFPHCPAFDELGIEGGGYTWHGLVEHVLREDAPRALRKVSFDPEGSLFCAVSADLSALRDVARALKKLEDPAFLDRVARAADLDEYD